MRKIEILLPAAADSQTVERIIDETVAALGLRVTLRGSLKKFPGCTHWHLKNGRAAGTLEITLWPQHQRAWFTVQDGRGAEWLNAEIERFGEMLRQRLSGCFSRP